MVYSETHEDFGDTNQKESFQYHVPRVRSLFTIKVSPDSTTADLPESAPNSTTSSEITNCYNSNLPPGQASLPEPLTVVNSDLLDNKDKDSQLRVPAQPPIISKSSKSAVANGSTLNVANEDKDFEIPLEESLKAVEDFIKREKELSKWNVGEDVLAKWKGNGLYYKARILDIFPSGIIVVLFDSYDIKEEIDYTELSKFFKKTSSYKRKGKSQEKSKGDAEGNQKVDTKNHVRARKLWRIPDRKGHGNSYFKRTDNRHKKILHTYQKKSPKILRIKSRTKARKCNAIQKIL